MASDGDSTKPADALRTSRAFLALGAALYLAWWFLVETLLPGSFNPLPSRLVVVCSMLAAFGATFASAWAARHAAGLLAGSLCVLTLHYGYLIIGNHGDPTWWAGCVLVVACAGAMPISRDGLTAYSVFAIVMTGAMTALEPHLHGSIFMPAIATILLLSNVALRSRLRAEDERKVAALARVERDRAQDANKLKGMFLALVSHELVTPLQSIRLNAESLERTHASISTEARAEILARMARATVRLTELIESLLEYTRVEAGRLELRIEELDLCAIAHDVVDELSPQAQSKGLTMNLRLAAEACPLRSDARIIRLIITNLASNAVRYTDAGSIDIVVEENASGQAVSVADTGRGIPAEAREAIFEPFMQLEPLHRKHLPGIGLGLALVKELTQALGARIEMSSVVGTGTTFRVVFPASAARSVA